MKLEKFIQYLRANDWLRYLLAMACLIGAILAFVSAMNDLFTLMGW